MAVNTGKVIAGGLVAGVVAAVCDTVVFGFLLKDRMAAEMNALNPKLAEHMMAPASMAFGIGGDLVIGLLLVWIYAAIRGTYGPGPKTAARSALVIWVAFGVVYGGMTASGMYSWHFFFVASVVGLVNVLLAAMAGCSLYKEIREGGTGNRE